MTPRSIVLPRAVVLEWLVAHALTLRRLAALIDRDPGLVSRVLRGQATSTPIWREIRCVMAHPRNPTVALRRLRRRDAAALERARRALRATGYLA